jgi:hypothetical protein
VSPLARRQLARWLRRYRTTAVALVIVGGLLAAFPSVVPAAGDRPGATTPTEVAGPAAPPSRPAPSLTPPSFGPPSPVSPSGTSPAPVDLVPIAPPPPDPGLVATPCPIDFGVEANAEPLPLADVLNLASPALPLLGPFVPFAVTGLPTVGPILPVVTPLIPLGQPVFVAFGPLIAQAAGPLAGYEAILLQPIAEPLAEYTPAMLDAERQFIAQLQPLLERVEGTGAIGCGVVLTSSLAGLVAEVQQLLGLDRLVLRLQALWGGGL